VAESAGLKMDLFAKTDIISLRDYQNEMTDKTIEYLRTHRDKNPVISAATGTGKSIVIASLAQRIARKNGVRILVATHSEELVDQNAAKLKAIWHGADIGIYAAGLGSKEIDNQIVFGMIQSLNWATIKLPFHVLIVDEAHTIGVKENSMWQKLIAKLKANYSGLRVIGLSATPFRLDSGSLVGKEDSLFDEIIYDYGMGRAIKDGWLVPLVSKETKTHYDISGVGKLAGEYNLKDLEAATNTDDMNKRAAAETILYGQNRKTWLIFCNGVAHSFAIAKELRALGVSCETVTGDTPGDERSRILHQFRSGELRAVTNNAVWTTGLDVPNIDMIVMLRHTLSGGLLVQMAGRGTRTHGVELSSEMTSRQRREAIAASPKPNTLFLDFVGNIKKHGFIDEIGPKEKNKGDGVAPMKPCPECFSILHAAVMTCPDCGYIFPPPPKETKTHEVYIGHVLSTVEEFRVVNVTYDPWNMVKQGKIPSLRVTYYCQTGEKISEWVCLQHPEGSFPQRKAAKWWRDRGGHDYSVNTPHDDIISSIIDFEWYSDLLKPETIKATKNEKGFFEVKAYGKLVKNLSYADPSLSFTPLREEEIPW